MSHVLVDGLYGRDSEVKSIEEAWDRDRIRVLFFRASPGVGKSAVGNAGVNNILKKANPRSFMWSSYNQASGEQTIGEYLDGFSASLADLFIQEANKHFGVDGSNLDDWEKGQALGEHLVEHGGLLYLDGLERQQADPNGYDGLQHRGLVALLQTIASHPKKGGTCLPCLCVITTQAPLEQLGRDYPDAVEGIELRPLTPDFGGQLLEGHLYKGSRRDIGIRRDLEGVSGLFGGRPLDLRLLAGYLGIAKRRKIDAAYEIKEHDYSAVLAELDRFFLADSEWKPGRQFLRLVGLYDCAVDRPSLNGLLGSKPIRGLTDSLPNPEKQPKAWSKFIKSMSDRTSLVEIAPDRGFDVHQLVRAYGADKLREELPDARKEGHRRLGEWLQRLARKTVDPIRRIAILYEALKQRCHAEDYEAAYLIYRDGIQEGGERPATIVHGIVRPEGLDPFFRGTRAGRTWSSPIEKLGYDHGALIIGEAGGDCWHVGQLRDALEAFLVAAAARYHINARREHAELIRRAAETASKLGDLAVALDYARRSVATAMGEDSGAAVTEHTEQVGRCLATLARILHLRGEFDAAGEVYREAAESSPEKLIRLIYSLWYADYLTDRAKYGDACEIARSALDEKPLPLDAAYAHLILGLASLRQGDWDVAQLYLDDALALTRRTCQRPHLASVLLIRSACLTIEALRVMDTDWARGNRVLDRGKRMLREAIGIIRPRPGSPDVMKLDLADYYLVAAHLRLVQGGRLDDAAKEAKRAAELIEECGYGRRRESSKRLGLAISALQGFLEEVPALCQDYKIDAAILIKVSKWVHDRTVEQKNQPSKKDKQEGHDLDHEMLPEIHLDPARLEQLSKRLEALLKPLMAELPSLLAEFGAGRESAIRLVWTLIEQNVRAAVETDESSGGVGRSMSASAARTLTTREAAVLFGLNADTLTTLGHRGKLGELRGRMYYFSVDELNHYIANPPRAGRPRKS